MQRLISLKLASNFTRKLTNDASSFVHSHRYKTFTSLTKPTQNQSQQFFSHCAHYQSCPSQIEKMGFGFFSNPALLKQFYLDSTNSLLRVSSKSLADARVRLRGAPFPIGDSGFNSSFVSTTSRWKAWFQGLSADDMVSGLIKANVAVFMLWHTVDRRFMLNNFTMSLDNIKSGRVHTLITSAFSMATENIISNMFELLVFGTQIGRFFGPEILLILYLAGEVGGSVFYLVHHALKSTSSKGQQMGIMDPSRTPGLGASGALYAIMLLTTCLFDRTTLNLTLLVPLPTCVLLVIFLIGRDTVKIIKGDSHISTHLGGAAVAAVAWRLVKGRVVKLGGVY